MCPENSLNFLFLSSKYEVISVFVDRTATELERHTEQLVSVIYRKIMYDYLCQVIYFLVNYTHIDNEKIKAIVPPGIFDGGSRKAPEVDYQTLLFKNT